MSTKTESASVATPVERAAPRTELDTQGKGGRSEDSKTLRRLSIEGIGLVPALAGLLIWRDRTSSGQTVVAGLVLATMITFSGQDVVLIGAALILGAVAFVQTIRGDGGLLRTGRPPRSERRLPS